MAKTTSQIIAENKIKREEAAAIAASRDKIHQQQMAGGGATSEANTAGILRASGYEDAAKAVEKSTGISSAKKTAVDQLWDRGSEQSVSTVTLAKQKENAAKKELEDYLSSDEYKQRTAERERKLIQDRVIKQLMTGIVDMQEPQIVKDEKEDQLRAAADLAQRDAKDAQDLEDLNVYVNGLTADPARMTQDQGVMATDLKEFASMPYEDRRALEMYIAQRDADYYDTLNFAQNGIQIGRAEQQAAGLFEKYGKQRIDELAETFARYRNEKTSQEVAKAAQKQGSGGFWEGAGASVAAVPAAALSGVGGVMGYAKEAGNRTGRYSTMDPNNEGNFLGTYSGNVKSAVAQNIEEGHGTLGKVGSVVYQAAMSTAESIARAYLGGGAAGGAGLAATATFSQTMADAAKQGATPGQAALLATADAAIEYLTEKIPLDEMISAAKGSNLKALLANTLRQAGIEATTEELSLVGSLIAEAAILMWDAWRNLSMLGNLKTQIRNFGSTGVWQPYVEVKRDIGAAVEGVVLRNKRNERTKSFLGTGKGDKDLIAWAKQDAKSKDAQRLMEYSGYTGNEAKNAIQDYRQILPGVLDTARKKNMELMENSDMLYKRNEYSRSLASFLKARGYTAEQLSSEAVPKSVLDQGRQYAVKEAMKATFNDRNSFSDSIVKLMKPKGDSPAILNIIKKGTIPFLRTPANIIHRAYEYSPASLGITLLTAKRDIDSGRMSASDVIDRVSSGLTGSAAMGFGAALAAGIVPGVRLVAEPDDDELLAGAQAYSIKIGGKYYAAGWLAPAMIPLFIGARLYEDITRKAQYEDGLNAWDVVEALVDTCAHSLDPLLELSMLSSFKTILESFSNAESYSEKAAAVAVNSVLEYFSQGIPTLFGQIEQATEAEKKSIYVNTENNIEKVVKKSIGNATKKIPGIDLYQTQKLDSFGEPVEAGDDYRKRIFDAFLNPASVTEETKDPVIKEITRLNSVQENSVTPPYAAKTISYTDVQGNVHKDFRLTEQQYQDFARTQGQTAYRLVAEAIMNPDYEGLTDKQKAEVRDNIYAYARETGEIAAMDDHYGYSESWMRQMKEGKEASEILRRVASSELSKAVSALDDAWDNNWDSAQDSEALRTAYDSYESMTPAAKREVRETATGTTAKYIEAREKGISHEDFLAAAENVATVKGTGSNGTVRDIDRRRAIANTTGLSQKEIDIIMKCYMPDYDPNDKSTDTTEVKYDYIRQEMGLSAKKYVAAYQAYLDNDKKRNPTIAAIRESLGCDYGTALKLYNVYDGEKWTKRTMLAWYEKQ